MKHGLTWVLVCLCISACGGGGADSGGATTLPTTPTPPPAATGRPALAASGYAGAGAQVRFGETYELANDQSLRGTPSSRGMSYAMVSKTPMQITFTSATMLTLDSQGHQYSLFDGDGDSVFEPTSGGHPKVLAVIVEKEAALVMAIELTGSGPVDTTYSAIGPNTDPTAIPASGSALYRGAVNAVLQPSINPSTQVSEFSGTGRFNVDFTANTVSGSMVYTQSSDTQFTQRSAILTVTLPSTSITGNTFETTAGTAQFNQIPSHGTRFGSLRIEGDFFGQAGTTLAGSFDGAGTDSSGNTAFLHGGFVAEK